MPVYSTVEDAYAVSMAIKPSVEVYVMKEMLRA